jgi:hypothetical protein
VLCRAWRQRTSAIELHLAFVEARQQHRDVEERPDAVVDLFEGEKAERTRTAIGILEQQGSQSLAAYMRRYDELRDV